MKRVVYILAAVLAIIATVIMTSDIVRQAALHYHGELLASMPIQWYALANDLIKACISLLFAAAAVVQLIKATPRVILLLSGTAVFMAVQAISVGQYLLLLVLAACLITALYELVLYGRRVKRLPVRPVKRGLLIAAGVIAALYAALTAINIIALLLSPIPKSLVAVVSVMVSPAGLAALAVLCFLKNWRAGDFARVFLVGESLLSVLLWPVNIANLLMRNTSPTIISVSVLVGMTSIVLVVFVLVHAAKHRREDNIPPAPDTQMAA